MCWSYVHICLAIECNWPADITLTSHCNCRKSVAKFKINENLKILPNKILIFSLSSLICYFLHYKSICYSGKKRNHVLVGPLQLFVILHQQ